MAAQVYDHGERTDLPPRRRRRCTTITTAQMHDYGGCTDVRPRQRRRCITATAAQMQDLMVDSQTQIHDHDGRADGPGRVNGLRRLRRCTITTKAQIHDHDGRADGSRRPRRCTTMTRRLLRAADRYAYTGCGSTAYSVETVYGGKGDLYTPDARPALLATPRRLTGDAPSLHWRRPVALLAGPNSKPKRGLLATDANTRPRRRCTTTTATEMHDHGDDAGTAITATAQSYDHSGDADTRSQRRRRYTITAATQMHDHSDDADTRSRRRCRYTITAARRAQAYVQGRAQVYEQRWAQAYTQSTRRHTNRREAQIYTQRRAQAHSTPRAGTGIRKFF